MVQINITAVFVLSALSALTSAAPLQKRINQNTIESKTLWEQACIKAGGATQCNPIAVKAAATLLRGAGDCEQQDSADEMIDLAKTLGNDPEMIRLAQLFVQQPRNAPDSLQVPYCQIAPKNAELNGLFHCQFAGSKFPTFSGDQTGNVPLGVAAVNPAGSCPANPAGPIPDGVQLNTLVQSPRAGGGAAASGGVNNNVGGGAAGNAAPATKAGAAGAAGKAGAAGAAGKAAPAAKTGANNGAAGKAAPAAPAAAGAKPFTRQNGLDAQALNAQFATLTPNSPCTAGENACINDQFAQCVNGKFVVTGCAAGTICAALPLVNSAGTSITCTTAADRDARIAATGA